ncbi:hypothetical protein Tco_0551717 [Tanacetum coccineum]
MIVVIEESHHGPSDAMHNPSQPFEWQSAPASELIRRIGLDSLECALPSQSISDIFPNLLLLPYLLIVIFMDTAYGRSQIRRIGNWSNALSCELLVLIRLISFVGYGVSDIQEKVKNNGKTDKAEHGNEKSAENQSRRRANLLRTNPGPF